MSFQAFSDYLLLEKKYSKHTVLAYNRDLEMFQEFLKEHHDSEPINKVGYSEIRQWIVELVNSGISNRTINRKVSSLNTYYKFLQKTESIEINPLKKHRALKIGKRVQLPFSEQELKSVLENSIEVNDFESARNHLIIELFYATGIRRIELVNIKLLDIDNSNIQIKVLGKRNKERYIPLIKPVIESLKCYLGYRDQLSIIEDKETLFLTKKGLKIYEKLNAVKELLGHTSLAATQVYTHNSIAKLKKVYAKSHPRNLR